MPTPEEQIQHTVETSHIIRELTQDPKNEIRQHRQVFEMSGKGVESNFTISQLANDKCFAAPPLTLTSVPAQTAITVHYVGPGMAGHPGIVHGGVISTIFDECCGQAAVTHFKALAAEQGTNKSFEAQPQEGVLAVTAQLAISFKNPARADAIIVTRAVVEKEKSSPRKAGVIVQMWQRDAVDAEKNLLVAEGTGLYIRPRANA